MKMDQWLRVNNLMYAYVCTYMCVCVCGYCVQMCVHYPEHILVACTYVEFVATMCLCMHYPRVSAS